MHVAQLGFFLDPLERPPAQVLVDWWPLVDTAEMVARAGAQVSVVQACRQSLTLDRAGVTYHFAAPESFAALLDRLEPDVFHVHGLDFPREVLALSRRARGRPILLQDHANRVPRFWRRAPHRGAIAAAAGVAFCAAEQAAPFSEASLLRPPTRIYEIPECSSRFMPGDRTAARRATGLHGNPAVLWVGHLDPNKDPLTVLDGIAEAVLRLPDLQLWCCFGAAPLLAAVRRRIANDHRLAGRVHLLGKVLHSAIETLMRAADVFVLGSHREGSGCSVIEALACGLPPVITDIPSFRKLTDGGRVGALWPCDDAAAMSAALLSVIQGSRTASRADVRAHFDRELSFTAVGRQLTAAYADLLGSA